MLEWPRKKLGKIEIRQSPYCIGFSNQLAKLFLLQGSNDCFEFFFIGNDGIGIGHHLVHLVPHAAYIGIGCSMRHGIHAGIAVTGSYAPGHVV